MTLAGYTDIGYKYEENQDCYRAGKISDSLGWMLLCDGMGGLSNGKMASHIAVDVISSAMNEELLNYVTPDEKASYMGKICQRANRAVFDASVKSGSNQMMGTTLLLAVVDGQDATIFHCGDSRVYHYRRRTLKQLTKDHSYVQELIDKGKITEEEAAHHPQKNIITRALGIDPKIVFDVIQLRLARNDILMMCSDGLSNQVQQDTMLSIFRYNDFYRVPRLLVEAGLETGGFDNITTVMMQV